MDTGIGDGNQTPDTSVHPSPIPYPKSYTYCEIEAEGALWFKESDWIINALRTLLGSSGGLKLAEVFSRICGNTKNNNIYNYHIITHMHCMKLQRCVFILRNVSVLTVCM